MEVTGKGRACIPEGLICFKKVCLKSKGKKKNSITGPGKPKVHQVVRYFLLAIFMDLYPRE